MRLSGRCLCEAVGFECSGPPLIVRACWCRTCQYLASGNASISAIFKESDLTVNGPLRSYESRADSGNHVIRSFCEVCGTPMLCTARESPGFVVVRAGAFNDREQLTPTVTIWTDSAPSWGCVNEEIEQYPKAGRAVG